ncbi:MAG: GatB/YqeY domain-containing protein [Spongiibacteraceae bacterium]|jgi:uncharacterized protein YqeY|nr:GatB/YqeY domain-containing protein [Spongiibacteraceae bacterium]
MSPELKNRLTQAMKDALRAQDKPRLGAIRMMLAEIKRVEVDERAEVDDTRVLAILDKMAKQRRDSAAQFAAAGRDDLVAQEQLELDVIAEFLPQPLTEAEIDAAIANAIATCGASGPADMGRVMAVVKPAVQGRADMAKVSQRVKQQLS